MTEATLVTQIRCKDCDSPVTLARKQNGLLVARCDCGNRVNVKVDKVLPEGWR